MDYNESTLITVTEKLIIFVALVAEVKMPACENDNDEKKDDTILKEIAKSEEGETMMRMMCKLSNNCS